MPLTCKRRLNHNYCGRPAFYKCEWLTHGRWGDKLKYCGRATCFDCATEFALAHGIAFSDTIFDVNARVEAPNLGVDSSMKIC